MFKPFITAIFLLLNLGVQQVFADPLVVVTQEGAPVNSLSRQEVADIFLGKRKLTVSGISLIPIDISDEALRENFYRQIADMNTMRVNAYWSRVVFSAQGRPPRILSLLDAKSLVAGQQGVITYLPENNAAGFKIVLRLDQ